MSLVKQKTILITGATGTLGKKLVEEILKSRSIHKIVLLVRGETNKKARERIYKFVKIPKQKSVNIYASDITIGNLGLNDQLYNKLTKEVTYILHCAANVRFSTTLEESRLVNVKGTENLIKFAKKSKNLSKFGYVSTAFVSGRRKGLILENELEHNKGFINSYEQSKYEAEVLVRKVFNELPINIFRPTILLDKESRNAVNYMLELFYNKRLPIIPGDKSGYVDMIRVNYCAFAIWKIFNEHFTHSKTYHIAAGPINSYTLDKLVEKVIKTFSKRKNLKKPRFINLNGFQILLVKRLAYAQIGVFKRLNTFATQLLYPKVFDIKNVVSLKDKQLDIVHVDTYFNEYLLDFLNKVKQ